MWVDRGEYYKTKRKEKKTKKSKKFFISLYSHSPRHTRKQKYSISSSHCAFTSNHIPIPSTRKTLERKEKLGRGSAGGIMWEVIKWVSPTRKSFNEQPLPSISQTSMWMSLCSTSVPGTTTFRHQLFVANIGMRNSFTFTRRRRQSLPATRKKEQKPN